jgi:hypothetical protein
LEKYASTIAKHISGSDALKSGIRRDDATVTLFTVLDSAALLSVVMIVYRNPDKTPKITKRQRIYAGALVEIALTRATLMLTNHG